MEKRLQEPQRLLETSSPLLKFNKSVKLPVLPVQEIKKHDCHAEEKVVVEEEKELTLRDILDLIFPPRKWTDKEGSDRVSRADITRLEEILQTRMEERNAKAEGYCPIRRSIFRDLFDEMIRQETVMCPERGILMMKIRDEFMLDESTNNALYENAVLYGNKKSVEANQDLASIEKAVAEETLQHDRIIKEIRSMEDAVQMSEKRYKEIAVHIRSKYKEKIDFYTALNNTIKAQIAAITHPKRYLISVTKNSERRSISDSSHRYSETS